MNTFYIDTITGKKKKVGTIDGNTMTKSILFYKHYFRNKDALGLDVDIVKECVKSGVRTIRLLDKYNRKGYQAHIADFVGNCFLYPKENSPYADKFQPSYFLPMKYWKKFSI